MWVSVNGGSVACKLVFENVNCYRYGGGARLTNNVFQQFHTYPDSWYYYV